MLRHILGGHLHIVTLYFVASLLSPAATLPDPKDYLKLKAPEIADILGPLDPKFKNPCFHSRLVSKNIENIHKLLLTA